MIDYIFKIVFLLLFTVAYLKESKDNGTKFANRGALVILS